MNTLQQVLTTHAWYLVDFYNSNKKHFLTNDQASRFIFIGKGSDCDVKLVRRLDDLLTYTSKLYFIIVFVYR